MNPHARIVATVIASIVLWRGGSAQAQLCLQYAGGTHNQNFDTLATSGAINTTLPSEFKFIEQGGNLTYVADDGSNSFANTYSYGTGTNTDRAFGEISSATLQSILGMCLVNNVGDITSLAVSYTGEQWRLGVADGVLDKLDFQFSLDAQSLDDAAATWTSVNALDFVTSVNTGAGAKNGNAASNRFAVGPATISMTSPLAIGEIIFLRWLPAQISGDNDGLAIDDFHISGEGPCTMDIDANGAIEPLADGILLLRAAFGFTGETATTGAIGQGAKRVNWTMIRGYLNNFCGASFAQ